MIRSLLIAALVAVTTASSSPIKENCIDGCSCEESLPNVRVFDCAQPISLSRNFRGNVTVFSYVSLIKFDGIDIDNITNNAFSQFNNLETLIFKNCTIENIGESALNRPLLTTVTFTQTEFAHVPELVSGNIEELTFDDCDLFDLPSLGGLTILNYLNVANNYIENVNQADFSGVSGLKELILSDNTISSIAKDVFEKNEELTTLDLSFNPIEIFEVSSKMRLEELILKSCKLKTFDYRTSKYLDLVTNLDLSNNEIAILPIDAFEGMPELTYIDLSSNLLVELDDNIFSDNINIAKIVLDNNRLETLPKFSTNESFETTYFSCSNCSLKSLDNNPFDQMTNLQTVILSNNKLENIQQAFGRSMQLVKLDLSKNNIKTIDSNAFSDQKNIVDLNLAGNPLKTLDPVVFVNMRLLETLDLTNTGLTQIWSNQNANIPSLQRLLIGKNRLTQITTNDLNTTPNIRYLDLNDNPFECSDNFRQSLMWIIEKHVSSAEGKTHEDVSLPSSEAVLANFNPDDFWKVFVLETCPEFHSVFDSTTSKPVSIASETEVTEEEPDVNDENDLEAFYEENEDDFDEYEEEKLDFDKTVTDISENGSRNYYYQNTNISPTKSILELTSVFVLTALVVSILAVVCILYFLKRNQNFNMRNSNLPRLKIPLWQHQLGHKKHSGSVYRPLSEDLSGPKTPIVSRYEFKQQPSVHNTIP